jgi:hypothetical protein
VSAVDVYAERLLAESKAKRTVATDTCALAYAMAHASVERFDAIAEAVRQVRVAGAFGKGYHESVAALASLLVDLVRPTEAV